MRDRVVEACYPGLKSLGLSPYDSTNVFYGFVDHLLAENATLLDFGAGRGSPAESQRATHRSDKSKEKVTRRIGCDVDPIVMENQYLDEAYVLESHSNYRIPLPDRSCDCVIADWVVEHLPDPTQSFVEIHRVLRPGGWFCIRTSNRYHFAYLLAAAVSDSKVENALLKCAQPQRQEVDVFPKLYRANSRHALRTMLEKVGFGRTKVMTWEPESGYLNFSAVTALVGALYHRSASVGILPRAVLMGFAEKSAEA